ncbi:hypothetical protein ACFVHW_09900 [Streptomyces sp. NPDC127110]
MWASRAFAWRATPAQQGAQPGEEHDERERLDLVVVGTALQPFGDV